MTPRRGSASFLALLVALVMLIGCGGSGGGGANGAPTISTQPTSKTVSMGSPVTFTVDASGSGTLIYQWWKDGSAISGATSATLTINSASTTDSGSYFATIENPSGITTSATVTLSISSAGAPVITSQPVAVSVPSGSPASFNVVATGTGLTYQWYKNGATIVGATGSTYSISSVSATNVGNYSVRVSNSNGNVDSNSVALSIASANAPSITTQPVSQAVGNGGSVTLSVVATGTSPLSYQWYKNGVAMSGRITASITLTSVSGADSASYYVIVTNSLGSATSSTATVDVQSLPVITTQPTGATVFTGTPVTLTAAATGSNLTYVWFRVGSGQVGSGPSYTFTVNSGTAGSYFVKVSNAAGFVNSSTALVALALSPTITVQPTPLTVGLGSAASFTVTATGDGTLSYQWYKDGTAISGATNATFTLSSTVANDAANYKVTVSNPGGTATSNTVGLTVLIPPVITSQPASLVVTAGSAAAFSVTATASGTITYQWYKNGVLLTGATGSTYSIGTTTLADAGSYKVVVTNAGVASTTSNTVTLTVN